MRIGAGSDAPGVGECSGDAGGDGESVSRGVAAGVDSQGGLAREASGMVGGCVGGCYGAAGFGTLLECAGNVSHNDDVLRSDLEKLSRQSVYVDRLGDRRENENSCVDRRDRELGTGA